MKKTRNPFSKFYRFDAFKDPLGHPLNEFPFYLDIELTNACNLKCIMCKREIMTREVGYMPSEIYRKLIDEIADYSAGVRYCRHGEPTLHPDFANYVAYANDMKVVNFLSTNGHYGKKKMQRVFEARPDIIRFSFQGTQPSEFERFRKPARFETVAANVRYCSEERRKRDWRHPYLIISTSILDEPPEEVDAFRRKWEPYVDRIEVGRTTFSWVGEKEEHKDLSHRVTVNDQYIPCLEVMVKLSVNWNGDITACCGDYDGELVLGNIEDISLKKAWDSPRLNEIRSLVAYDTRHAELPLCRDCFKGELKFKDNPV